MTHTASHIIISAIKAPVTANGKWKVWHCIVVLCAISWAVGKFA